MATATMKTFVNALRDLLVAHADVGANGVAIKKGPQLKLTKSQNVVLVPSEWERPPEGIGGEYGDETGVDVNVAVVWSDTEANFDTLLDLCQACIDAVESDRSFSGSYDNVELTKVEFSKGPWVLAETNYRHAILTVSAYKEG